jgi:hypothetical protein
MKNLLFGRMSFVWLVYFLFAELLSLLPSQVSTCILISKEASAENYTGNYSCASMHEAIFRFIGYVWRHADHDNIIAFGTILIALFTYVLYRSTNKLWQVTIKSDEQTRELFSTEHRPWLIPRFPEVEISSDGSSVRFGVSAQNIGKTPAFCSEVRITATRSQIAARSVRRVKDFALTLTTSSQWDDWQETIFPGDAGRISAQEDTEIHISGGSGSAVRIVFCVTYSSGTDPTIKRSAGEVFFNNRQIDGLDRREDGWFKVLLRDHDFRVTYAD